METKLTNYSAAGHLRQTNTTVAVKYGI